MTGDDAFAATGETLAVDVLGNDFDPDDDLDAATLTITLALTSGTAQAVTSTDLGAHVTYTAAGAAGIDMFTYQVCDRRGACSTSTTLV